MPFLMVHNYKFAFLKIRTGWSFRTSFILFILLALVPVLGAQPDSLSLLREWPLEADEIYIDPLDNIYLVSKLDEIVKLNANGQPQFRFQDQKLGNLSLVDVSNPFNVLLYYPEFQVIVILDRTLNESGRVRLSAFGLFDVEAVGMSSDNQFWIFDELNGTLKKINTTGKILSESQQIPTVLGIQVEPVRVLEVDQLVYVQCVHAGLLVF